MVDNALKCRISYLRFFHISTVFLCHIILRPERGEIIFVVTRVSEKKYLAKKHHLVILCYEQSGTQKLSTETFRCGFYFNDMLSAHDNTHTHTLLKTINYSSTHSANLCRPIRTPY